MKSLHTACLCSFFLLFSIAIHAQQLAKSSANASNTLNARAGTADLTMKGAYTMLMQVENNGLRDSMTNIQQMKLYTDNHFMYAHAVSGDSIAYFGIGTYRLENDKLMEYPFYTTAGGAQTDTFEIRITKMPDGYVQVINFPPDSQGRKFVLTEEYRNVGKAAVTPLDGAWKQTKAINTPKNGATTVNNSPTQYKIFQSGHYIWGRTWYDSAMQRQVSYHGYGTFEMKGRNEVRERAISSSLVTEQIGKYFTLNVQFKGKDSYEQTIVNANGDKSVEVYERLK